MNELSFSVYCGRVQVICHKVLLVSISDVGCSIFVLVFGSHGGRSAHRGGPTFLVGISVAALLVAIFCGLSGGGLIHL